MRRTPARRMRSKSYAFITAAARSTRSIEPHPLRANDLPVTTLFRVLPRVVYKNRRVWDESSVRAAVACVPGLFFNPILFCRFARRRLVSSATCGPSHFRSRQVDWALGSMLYEINALPWSYVPPSGSAAETSAAAAGATAEDGETSSSSKSENSSSCRWGRGWLASSPPLRTGGFLRCLVPNRSKSAVIPGPLLSSEPSKP